MQTNNGDIFKNIIIDKLQDAFKLMLDPITIDNHHGSIDMLYVTGDLDFLVILLGKEFSSPKWCFKCKLHPKVWLEYGHKIGEDLTLNALRLISESYSTGSSRLSVNEAPIWECVEGDKYMFPVLHNQMNLSNNMLYNLFDYGNEFIEKITSKEQVTRNFLMHSFP